MSAIATYPGRRTRTRPELRLLPGADGVGAPADPELRLVADGPRILVAGASSRLRATVRGELAAQLAPGTLFGEAGMVWEVLEQAPRSGVVMLAGDLKDASAADLTRLLARRHPRLPIVALEPDSPGTPATPATPPA